MRKKFFQKTKSRKKTNYFEYEFELEKEYEEIVKNLNIKKNL